jgi:hypothetical protein
MYQLHFFCLNDNVSVLDHHNLDAFTPDHKISQNGIHFEWCMLSPAQPHPLYTLWAAIS